MIAWYLNARASPANVTYCFLLQWLGTEEGADERDGYQALDDPQYQDIRAEASTHYRLRHECFQKAQEAYKRGLKAVASFYSQQVITSLS